LAHLFDAAFVDEVLFLANNSIIAVGAAVPREVAAINGVVFKLAREVGGGIDAGFWRGRWILVPGDLDDASVEDVSGLGVLRLGV
jgi:hypothetical protein